MPKLTIEPGDEHVEVMPGESVRDALARAGLSPQTPCNGKGICGRCRVLVVSGGQPLAEPPHRRISDEDAARGVRLACKLVPRGDLTIRLLGRVESTAAEAEVGVATPLREPEVEREAGRGGGQLGLALDLGTTTLVATLVSLRSSRELATRATLNPQVRFGHDVITRIEMGSRPEGLHELAASARQGIGRLVRLLCSEAGRDPEAITEVVVGGNTTMLQLAAEVDPAPLGEAPFAVDIDGGRTYPAESFGLKLGPTCSVYVPPVLHAYAGSDVTAGLAATEGFFDRCDATLLLDVGTNGELALSAGGRQVTTSAAAGPAFEGMGLSCGMIAGPGAVDAAWTGEGDLRVHTIDDAPAEGICGSGVVDLVAALYRLGVVDETGRMRSPEEAGDMSPSLGHRLVEMDEMPAFHVAEEVYLTQDDVRQVQLAKAAVRTAAEMILEELDVTTVDRLILAGGFGQTLRPRSMKEIGMLPPRMARRVVQAGNTSLQGCVELLRNRKARRQLESRTAGVTHLMLAKRPDYMERFVESMDLPCEPPPSTATGSGLRGAPELPEERAKP